MKNKNKPVYTNQHATIQSQRLDAQVGGFTYTDRREDDFDVMISTNSSNTSILRVEAGSAVFSFSGRQARTLQRLLNKHYENCGASGAFGFDQY